MPVSLPPLSDLAGYGVLLASGALFAGVGGAMALRILRLRRGGVRVPGVVVGRAVSRDPGEAPSYAAVVEFTTREGRRLRVRQQVYSSSNRLRAGRRVTVAYDPRNPERADVVEAWSQLTGAVVFLLGGVFGLVLGAWLLVGALL
ncbi:DUF3592 domain-containing protein [Streptomonospora nanhaiensis]|uniref:DUF3592 domain-containing protein n=1 Tax=Streptomonospora nanhaiensis TaxID=1323731 RepID=A0A853BLW9_9ACTN|nr:DUF3592 domain-containing protein [Streptomonospora nanhaiensis]MBV2366093.1 DUF3592 domain-containing protein [Streptomonospora nanhaiensis]MBX9391434.1 DUF3592 domain-containing protein [Streptomonospora nanhaiensis]NYI96569.1 hypothetical protein [Streptomonospora nanhaiensis]